MELGGSMVMALVWGGEAEVVGDESGGGGWRGKKDKEKKAK